MKWYQHKKIILWSWTQNILWGGQGLNKVKYNIYTCVINYSRVTAKVQAGCKTVILKVKKSTSRCFPSPTSELNWIEFVQWISLREMSDPSIFAIPAFVHIEQTDIIMMKVQKISNFKLTFILVFLQLFLVHN